MTRTDDDALEARLAQALGPDADDTAPLSRAVLNRLAGPALPGRASLAEVLAEPLPAAGLMLGLLLLAGGLGYAFSPLELDEVSALTQLLGPGF
ncbi:MAG: hypothetical protein V4753_06030 [Pseudomonadota bacterium]